MYQVSRCSEVESDRLAGDRLEWQRRGSHRQCRRHTFPSRCEDHTSLLRWLRQFDVPCSDQRDSSSADRLDANRTEVFANIHSGTVATSTQCLDGRQRIDASLHLDQQSSLRTPDKVRQKLANLISREHLDPASRISQLPQLPLWIPDGPFTNVDGATSEITHIDAGLRRKFCGIFGPHLPRSGS